MLIGFNVNNRKNKDLCGKINPKKEKRRFKFQEKHSQIHRNRGLHMLSNIIYWNIVQKNVPLWHD